MAKKIKQEPIVETPETTEQPVLSMGIFETPEGWRTVLLTTVGDKVVSREVGDPQMRGFALNELKILYVRKYLKGDQ